MCRLLSMPPDHIQTMGPYILLYTNIRMYVCVYIYIYVSTHTQRDSNTYTYTYTYTCMGSSLKLGSLFWSPNEGGYLY